MQAAIATAMLEESKNAKPGRGNPIELEEAKRKMRSKKMQLDDIEKEILNNFSNGAYNKNRGKDNLQKLLLQRAGPNYAELERQRDIMIANDKGNKDEFNDPAR